MGGKGGNHIKKSQQKQTLQKSTPAHLRGQSIALYFKIRNAVLGTLSYGTLSKSELLKCQELAFLDIMNTEVSEKKPQNIKSTVLLFLATTDST